MNIVISAVKELAGFIKKYQPSLFLFSSIQIIFSVVTTFMLNAIISFIIYVISLDISIYQRMIIILIYTAIMALSAAIGNYTMQINDSKMYSVKLQITLLLYRKSMYVDYEMLEDVKYRELLNRAQKNGIESSAVGFEQLFTEGNLFINAVFGAFIYSILFLQIHWGLSLMLFILSLTSIYFMFKAQNFEHFHKSDFARHDQPLQYYHHILKLAKNGKDIRVFKLQNSLLERINDHIKQRLIWIKKTEQKYFTARIKGDILSGIRDCIIYGYFVYSLFNGMDVALFLFYVSSVLAFSIHITNIVNHYNEVKRASLGIKDFDSYMELGEIYENGCIPFPEGMIKITFDHVCFRYPNSDKDILHDITFTINKEEKIAIVGNNGAGKSTLVKLLCGMYKPTQGKIFLNDININELNKQDVFKNIAIIFQDSEIMAYSIKKNISCTTNENTDMQQVWECLDFAGLKEKVLEYPNKENTYLSNIFNDDGVMLSGGEKQKMLMARALYKKAPLLILDEPSVALDAIAEKKLYENYLDTAKNCTSIFISHRLASTRFSDRILLFEKGIIKEEGTHSQLLNKQGLYAEMFNMQASYYKEEGKDNEKQY